MEPTPPLLTADTPAPSQSSRWALAFVFVIIFLDILGLTILSPVLAYIVRQYSSSALTVTLMTVAYAAAQFLAAPLLGRLSDRYGRRTVLLLSILGSAIGYILFGVGGALWVLFLSRVIDGFTGGNISTASAYIADITPPELRAKNFGLIGLAFGLGYVLGPALGGLLSRVSLTAPAFAAAALSFISFVVGFFVLEESLPPERRTLAPFTRADLNPLTTIVELFRSPTVGVFLMVQCAFLFAFAGVNSVLPVYLIEKFSAPPTQLAGLFVFAGLATAIVQAGWVGQLTQRYGEKRLTLIGLALQIACYLSYLAIAITPLFWLLYPISGLSGGSSALIFAALGALISNHVSEREQGKAAGVNAALTSLMNAGGPLWAGAVYDRLTPAAPFWSAAICLAFAVLLLSRVKMGRGREVRAQIFADFKNQRWRHAVEYIELSEQDAELLKQAIEASDRLYVKGIQEVGAAVRTTGGQVFSGIHFETSTGFANICGEIAAICCMVAAGRRDLGTVAAVWRDPNGKHYLLPPCGRCREVISDFNPQAWVIVTTMPNHWEADAITQPGKVQIADLLPLKSNELKTDL